MPPKRIDGEIRFTHTLEAGVPGYRAPESPERFKLRTTTLETIDLSKVDMINLPDAAKASSIRDPRFGLERVIGDDDRKAVPAVAKAPWRKICSLRILSRSGRTYAGTGWLAGRRTVITAGHCVYLHDDGGLPEQIEVTPALEGTSRPYGSAVAKRFATLPDWVAKRHPESDLGAIFLDADLGQDVGWFAHAQLPDPAMKGATLGIAGYPVDLDHATRLYYHSRRASAVTARLVYYEIDTYGGQSGAPIWVEVSGEPMVVGVHTTGESFGNRGVRFDDASYAQILDWRKG